MVMNAGEKFDDFDEDAIKFLNMLGQYAEKNTTQRNIDFNMYIDVLKTKMEQIDISIQKLDALLEIMESHQRIVEYYPEGGYPWIVIRQSRVREVQHVLKSITCPDCHKRILTHKTVIYCPSPDCDYQRDEE